jgi:hypothetical protein
MKMSRAKAASKAQAKRAGAVGRRARRLGTQQSKRPFLSDVVLRKLAALGLPKNRKVYNARLRELLNTVPSPRSEPHGDGNSGGRVLAGIAAAGSFEGAK